MGLFNRKKRSKESNKIEAYEKHEDVTLSDGRVISVLYVDDVEGGKIRHSDGRITRIKTHRNKFAT